MNFRQRYLLVCALVAAGFFFAAMWAGHFDQKATDGLWHVTISSDEKILDTGEGEIRTKPDWRQVGTFKDFPISFSLAAFDPSKDTLVVQWWESSDNMPTQWLCEGDTLHGAVKATDPKEKKWVGVPRSNGVGGCDVALTTEPENLPER